MQISNKLILNPYYAKKFGNDIALSIFPYLEVGEVHRVMPRASTRGIREALVVQVGSRIVVAVQSEIIRLTD